MTATTTPRLKSVPPELFENLARQIDLSLQLLEILEQEQDILLAMDTQGLFTLTRRKEYQLNRLQLLDLSFQEIAKTLVADSSPEPVRLREVIELAGDREAARLEQDRVKLVALCQKIQDRNLVNKLFARDVLGYLNDAVSLITNAIAGQSAYSAKGSIRPSSRQPALISREI
jgi:flagellar biosynthesis/type III secretory pathway chaperone